MKHIHKDMKKHDIINKYIRKYGYTDYLEIGVRHGITYNNIECDNKVGIDPNSNFDKMIDSDSFFSSLDKKFDIVFIDGLHTDEQLEKDILNSLDHLTENGTIVCHDCNPQSEISQRVPRETKHWNGSCWKAIVRLRRDRDDLEVFTINTDEGCAVIRRGKQKTLSIKSDLTYQNLEKNRIEWLNLITNEKEKTTYRIYQFQPYALDGNYGAEVRYYCDLVKNEEDWIIIADYDVMCLTTHHIHKIKQYIDAYPDTGMFLPYTNRVKQMNQVLDKNLFEDPNILTHKNKADEIDNKQHFGVTEIHHVISGYFMVFKKSTYTKVGIPDGLLGVDNRFSKRILEAGMKIRMMNSIYAFHYYRFKTGINNKNHLKNIKT
jgi:hypothetical protein